MLPSFDYTREFEYAATGTFINVKADLITFLKDQAGKNYQAVVKCVTKDGKEFIRLFDMFGKEATPGNGLRRQLVHKKKNYWLLHCEGFAHPLIYSTEKQALSEEKSMQNLWPTLKVVVKTIESPFEE